MDNTKQCKKCNKESKFDLCNDCQVSCIKCDKCEKYYTKKYFKKHKCNSLTNKKTESALSECFELLKKKDEDFNDEELSIIKRINRLKQSEKTCIACEKTLSGLNFYENRKVCIECFNRKRNRLKVCLACNGYYSSNYFKRHKCLNNNKNKHSGLFTSSTEQSDRPLMVEK